LKRHTRMYTHAPSLTRTHAYAHTNTHKHTHTHTHTHKHKLARAHYCVCAYMSDMTYYVIVMHECA